MKIALLKRLAEKEAFSKAMGCGVGSKFPFKDVGNI
jgi:phosphopantetheinyl transferase (holo-ACP synthase)